MLLCIGFLLPLIRFNGNTWLIKQTPYDQRYFTAYTWYFKGTTTDVPIKPMTNWRFLLPLMASFLPINPPTSINLLNYLAFVIAAWVLVQTIKKINNHKHAVFFGLLTWLYAFPAMYYTCIGYADVFCIMFVYIGVFAVITNSFGLLLAAFVLGFLTKETAILLLPFFTAFNYQKLTIKKLAAKSAFLLLTALVLRFTIKTYAPVTEGYSNQTFWIVSYQSFANNLTRFNTWFASLITLLPVLLYLFLNRLLVPTHLKRAMLLTALCAVGLWVYSFITTVADGRIFWHLYPMFLLSWAYAGFNGNVKNIKHLVGNK